ncbi:hypothetical protein O3M35_006760 [Rhynocoris fuscipes]|uniref:DALR anticodon binding domain-containing protein n=1 Tax=Rhynocoris fuscipes TaxID=488301 RepID=A0AAW1DM94_9HEMI
MLQLFEEIEWFLNVHCSEVLSKNNVKFYRVYKNHHQGDYKCIIRNNMKSLDTTLELFDKCLMDIRPLWKNYLKFLITDGKVCVFFNRTLCFLHGLKNVIDLGELYGSNNLYPKIFMVNVDTTSKLNSLTNLRAKTVADILQKLLSSCGGTIVQNIDNESLNARPNYNIIISQNNHKNTNDDSIIFIQVGSVLNIADGQTITTDEYFKLRTEEIDSMCDYKLEINNVTTNREDLVKTTVVFDLVQSNIHKTMSLNLYSENPDIKTSCKGALFVMYNYVRLVALLEKFDYLVSCKKYSPLPSMDEIDFSLLSEDREWALMFDYILYWPTVIKQSLENFKDGKPKIHNICKFLMGLSSYFSVYYHHTRILTDSRPHLMSLIYARIYFLKAIAQVYKNALNLLQLRPLIKM